MRKFGLITVLFWLLAIAGEVQCVYKMCTCNWDPIGKAEVIYTAATFTGLGSVVGWIDIKDN